MKVMNLLCLTSLVYSLQSSSSSPSAYPCKLSKNLIIRNINNINDDKKNLNKTVKNSFNKYNRNNSIIGKKHDNENRYSKLLNKLADLIGYLVGLFAIFLYFPIIIDLINKKNSYGYSIITWLTNIISYTLAITYSIKKNYKISVYIDIIALYIQSIIIFGLISYYNHKINQFFIIVSILISFQLVMTKLTTISSSILFIIQIIRIILDSFSLLPQIYLNFKNHIFQYNEYTAFMSSLTNGLRIFTTLQLVKDPFMLIIIYILGLISNIILLLQFLLYR